MGQPHFYIYSLKQSAMFSAAISITTDKLLPLILSKKSKLIFDVIPTKDFKFDQTKIWDEPILPWKNFHVYKDPSEFNSEITLEQIEEIVVEVGGVTDIIIQQFKSKYGELDISDDDLELSLIDLEEIGIVDFNEQMLFTQFAQLLKKLCDIPEIKKIIELLAEYPNISMDKKSYISHKIRFLREVSKNRINKKWEFDGADVFYDQLAENSLIIFDEDGMFKMTPIGDKMLAVLFISIPGIYANYVYDSAIHQLTSIYDFDSIKFPIYGVKFNGNLEEENKSNDILYYIQVSKNRAAVLIK